MDRASTFPVAVGVLFGIGLGGFFDGIILHQLLQWHHMVSGWYPPTTLENLRLNTVWDGLFHSATYVVVVLALWLFWRADRQGRPLGSGRGLWGSALLGWGGFNVVEGLVDHHALALHRVNETVPLDERLAWDLGFLAWGAAMVVAGFLLVRSHRRDELAAVSRF